MKEVEILLMLRHIINNLLEISLIPQIIVSSILKKSPADIIFLLLLLTTFAFIFGFQFFTQNFSRI